MAASRAHTPSPRRPPPRPVPAGRRPATSGAGCQSVARRAGRKGKEARGSDAQSCQITGEGRHTDQQAEMSCTVGEMPASTVRADATDHEWRVTSDKRESEEALCCSSYGPPILGGITGPGASDADTGGGQAVVISGKNCGR